MIKIPVRSASGAQTGEVVVQARLPGTMGLQAVHDAVTAYLAAQRAGTACTKTRGEVSGGGRKPYRQKGTGRARAGSIRSPIWRGGGVVFGPKPRDYSKRLPKKVVQLAFCRAFLDKAQAGQVSVIEEIRLPEPKTRHVAALLSALKLTRGALIVLDKDNEEIRRAARNIPRVSVTTAASLNAYDVLAAPALLVTRPAMTVLEERIRQRLGGAS